MARSRYWNSNQGFEFISGIKSAFPIILGYLPIGFAYGVLAKDIGLSNTEIVLMSIFVFAGSAQFIAVGLLGAGASGLTIVITTFLVNLRHLLMSASLVPYIQHFRRKYFPLVSFGITDESYGVALGRFKKHRATEFFMLGLNSTAHLAWVLSSLLGAIFGSLIANPETLGLNFALPAMFIALLVFQLVNKLTYLVGIIAGFVSTFISLSLPGNWNIMIATILAATIGVIIEEIRDRRA